MECIVGSAMYFMSTGISLEWKMGFVIRRDGLPGGEGGGHTYTHLAITHHSQTLKLLSSDVVTKRLFSSTKVIVFTAPKCLSYSCVISPLLVSHCIKTGVQGFRLVFGANMYFVNETV